jgi:hypothetical protein
MFLIPALAYAQVGGSISGRVEDQTSAVISGAKITIKSSDTKAVRVTTTSDSGVFSAPSLPIGSYEIQVEKPGFKTAVRKGITLAVGQEAVQNIQLDVGEVHEVITTNGESLPLVNTTTSPISGLVDWRQVNDLPLNGRSFDNLITLNPGAVNYSAMKSQNTSTSNGNTFTVAGRRTSENLVILNGVEYTGSSQLAITPGGVSGELLGIDAVLEFNVLTDTYGAEYGKRAGAQVNVATRQGTNVLHGSVFEFLRNSALDSPGYFDQGTTPPFRRNQFGGAAGGPLKKNKWFLFGNYEGFRQSLAVSSVSVVPDAQARQGFLPDSKTGVYSKPANLDSRMLQYMQFWPDPNGGELLVSGIPSGTALSYNTPKQPVHEDFGTARSDYMIRDGDTLTTSYTIDDGHSQIPLADPLFASANILRNQVASIGETHVFSPTVLNVFTAGYSRAAFNLNSVVLGNFPANTFFVTGAGPGGIVIGGGTTTTGVSAITSAGPNNAAGAWNRRNLFTYADGVQISRGMHQISAGVWFQRMRDNEDSASRQLGQASFGSLATFLSGTVTSFQVIPDPNELGWRSLFGAAYFQDAIKLRTNFTLQAGLRYEFTTGWNEVSGRASNYVTDSNGLLVTAPRVGHSAFTENNATKLFAPRVAIAWDVFGNGKTAIRSGFGTYYSLIDDLAFLLNSLPPYNGSVSLTGALPNLVPITPGVPPAPGTIFAPQGVQPNAKTPTVEEWNFTIEQQLDQKTVLRAAYVGSFGYHGFVSVDPNTVPAQICQSATCVSGGTPGTTKGSVVQGQQYIPVSPSRPNSQLGAGFFWYTEGNTSYNALQLDVTHRMAKGLQFRANYTFSKNLDINSGLTGAQANNQAQMVLDRNNIHRDWGLSALNIRHQGSISASYELPFWHGSRLGGWQVNAIATLLTGFPFTPQVGSNRSGDGDTRNPDRPDLNPSFSGPVILGQQMQWFNPSAFMLPTPGTYGNLGRGVYEGPGLANIDFSVFKNTALTERTSLQFRAEMFNLFDRVNFGTPNAVVFSNGVPSPSAGLITTLATLPRQIQFGLKLIF